METGLKELINELEKCKNDHKFFTDKYCKVVVYSKYISTISNEEYDMVKYLYFKIFNKKYQINDIKDIKKHIYHNGNITFVIEFIDSTDFEINYNDIILLNRKEKINNLKLW